MTSSEDRARAAYGEAVAYINAATDRADRMRRKSEVFHIIYGNDALRASCAPTEMPPADEADLEDIPGAQDEGWANFWEGTATFRDGR